MVGITLSPEQIRAAPPEVRRFQIRSDRKSKHGRLKTNYVFHAYGFPSESLA